MCSDRSESDINDFQSNPQVLIFISKWVLTSVCTSENGTGHIYVDGGGI